MRAGPNRRQYNLVGVHFLANVHVIDKTKTIYVYFQVVKSLVSNIVKYACFLFQISIGPAGTNF